MMVSFVALNKYLPGGNSMRITLHKAVLAVLVFAALYLSSRTAAATRCTTRHEIEIYHPKMSVNGTETFYRCLPCPKCPFGQGGSVECGARVPRGTPVECHECVAGQNYSDVHDTGMCKPCPSCGNKRVLRECSLREKTVCSNDCKLGFHHKSVTNNCEKCSPCCVGKKYAKHNIYPRECRDMPLNKKCEKIHFTDNCPHMRVSTTTSHPTATLSSKPKTTSETTPPPNSINTQTTTPSVINDADKEHKGIKTRANSDNGATIGLCIAVACLLFVLIIIIITCICQKKRNGISSNSSSTTSITDESQGENKKDVKIEMEPPDSPERTESRLANQSGARRKMRKYPKTKQVSPLKKVAYQEVNQSYTYSELETADQEQIKNLAKPTLDKERPAMLVLKSEELNSMISRIPEGHLLSNLPEELIDHVSLKLDAPSTLCGWRKVGLALGVDKDRLDFLEREDKRQGGSPTAELLKGVNAQFPDAPTKTFVEALHSEKRDDIAKAICNWKW